MSRSDFFHCVDERRFDVAASSCWLEGKAKTPAGKAEGVRPRRKRSLAWKSTAV